MPAITLDSEEEKPTVRMSVMTPGDQLTIEFSDPDKVAAFLDLAAQLLRTKKKITLAIE